MKDAYKLDDAHKLDSAQVESIISKLVPLIAKEEDHDFFRAVLHIKAENSSSADFFAFVSKMLESKS